MARKSAAALAIGRVGALPRLAPPPHLEPAEQDFFLQVVEDLPADSFSAKHTPHIAAYAEHMATARGLSRAIKKFDMNDEESGGLRNLDRLMSMRRNEIAAAMKIATSLRITRHSVAQKTAAASAEKKSGKVKLWDE